MTLNKTKIHSSYNHQKKHEINHFTADYFLDVFICFIVQFGDGLKVQKLKSYWKSPLGTFTVDDTVEHFQREGNQSQNRVGGYFQFRIFGQVMLEKNSDQLFRCPLGRLWIRSRGRGKF